MFFEILEKEIKKRNLTLNKLAKEAGFSQASTDRWKKGSMPNMDAFIKLCKYLNVSADYLLELKPPEPPPEITENEQLLIEYYRTCDERSKEYLLDTAKREASRAAPPNTEKLLNSRIG